MDPDLIVVDWDQDQAMDLIDFAAESPPILVLASEPQPPWMTEALRAGIRGILPRDASISRGGRSHRSGRGGVWWYCIRMPLMGRP